MYWDFRTLVTLRKIWRKYLCLIFTKISINYNKWIIQTFCQNHFGHQNRLKFHIKGSKVKYHITNMITSILFYPHRTNQCKSYSYIQLNKWHYATSVITARNCLGQIRKVLKFVVIRWHHVSSHISWVRKYMHHGVSNI